MVNGVKELKLRIREAELHLSDLKIQLERAETDTESPSPGHFLPRSNWPTRTPPASNATTGKPWPMHADEYTRYGRQMIMPEIGLKGLSFEHFHHASNCRSFSLRSRTA